MSTHSHHSAESRIAFIVRCSALWGLFITLLTLVLSSLVSDALQDGGTDVLRAVVTTALLVGPFVLALVALRWQSSAAHVTWLLCGLVALGVGGILLASGVGVFLAAAGAGLIAAWWMSR